MAKFDHQASRSSGDATCPRFHTLSEAVPRDFPADVRTDLPADQPADLPADAPATSPTSTQRGEVLGAQRPVGSDDVESFIPDLPGLARVSGQVGQVLEKDSIKGKGEVDIREGDITRACPTCPADAVPVGREPGQDCEPARRRTEPPLARDCVFARFEVWRNQTGAKTTLPEWVIKIYSVATGEEFYPEVMPKHIMPFSNGATRFRKRARRMMKAGTLDEGWGKELIDASQQMHPNALIALVEDMHSADARGRAQTGFHAILHLNDTRDAPARLRLYTADGGMIEVTGWVVPNEITQRGSKRKANAAGWIGYHDPTGRYAEAWQRTQRVRTLDARDQRDRSRSPFTEFAEAVGVHLFTPLEQRLAVLEAAAGSADGVVALLRAAREEIAEMHTENARLRQEVSALKADVQRQGDAFRKFEREIRMAALTGRGALDRGRPSAE